MIIVLLPQNINVKINFVINHNTHRNHDIFYLSQTRKETEIQITNKDGDQRRDRSKTHSESPSEAEIVIIVIITTTLFMVLSSYSTQLN